MIKEEGLKLYFGCARVAEAHKTIMKSRCITAAAFYYYESLK